MNVSYYERSSNLVYILTHEPSHTALQLTPVDGNEQPDEISWHVFDTWTTGAQGTFMPALQTSKYDSTAANWGKVTRLTIRLLDHLKIGTFLIWWTCLPPHIAIVHVMVLACMQGTCQAPGKRRYIDASHRGNIHFWKILTLHVGNQFLKCVVVIDWNEDQERQARRDLTCTRPRKVGLQLQ